ncbi:hypothetical protein BDV96DRAFT_588217 [Lophiotrema nucula]|uniref:Uncharacterized protein n=1 Tax=Lophiotrema nucula TaxID=690887 RepID=A0A6A5YKN2_9PLEO|nr:hypothetical protein BDV96DRAFT_588217 [Lophiotrema nucula]
MDDLSTPSSILLNMDQSTIPFLQNTDHEPSPSTTSIPNNETNPTRTPPLSSQSTKSHSLARISLYILAAYGILSLLTQTSTLLSPPIDVYRPHSLPPSYNLCTCGPTLSSALSRGCVYDSLAAAWLPPHCRDTSLTTTFEASGPHADGSWPYYLDANGTLPLSVGEIAAMGEKARFWASREWHVAHCLWYWEKYVRMRDTGVVMERRFDGVAHVRHCRRLVMRRGWKGAVLVEVKVVMSSGFEEEG